MFRYYSITVVLLISQMFFLDCNAQRKAIAGDIVDSVSGKKIGSVNIFESLAGIGTISNDTGNFRLLLNRGMVNLSVSINGYKTWEEKFVFQADTILNIALHPLKEVNSVAAVTDSDQAEAKGKVGVWPHIQKTR